MTYRTIEVRPFDAEVDVLDAITSKTIRQPVRVVGSGKLWPGRHDHVFGKMPS
ncbi:hypothetical protein FF80_01868 [Devosia sp. LC5]|uniref:hypothetical protein n=1 Tax=Devosia sp. LC5 TaxID=1502724 RepID=UPI0004E34963|nr:hypothetical protein [Devosia sp. LC5]KFC68428.1 hypothetical protein FF80_01868 [Devosia sp. LC5]